MNSNSMEPTAVVHVARVEKESRYRKASLADSPAPARSGMARPVTRSQYSPRALARRLSSGMYLLEIGHSVEMKTRAEALMSGLSASG